MKTSRERLMRNQFLIVLAALLVLIAGPAGAWTTNEVPCDFVTGGGVIVHNGAHANFRVAARGRQRSLSGTPPPKEPARNPPALQPPADRLRDGDRYTNTHTSPRT